MAPRVRPLAAVLLAAAGCSPGASATGPGQGGGTARPALKFPVEVAPVEARRVEFTVGAVGSVEAFERVQVTARVAGAIEQVRFSEGDFIGAGQVLVEIEPERYRIAVRSARAALDAAESQAAEATDGLARREEGNEKTPGLFRDEEVQSWRIRVRSTTADAQRQKAALDLAELNLRDALVRAPAAGLIQTRNVQTGQYVQPGAILATLVRREPLLLRFAVSEEEAAHLRPGLPATFTVRDGGEPSRAELKSVAESADLASRMVAVTARITDPRRATLRPGAFAEVTVPIGTAAETAVVPQTAVRPSERGFLAFVVEDGVARERVLKLGLRTADGRVEVRSGVEPGELLVVRGAEALRDGARVQIADGQGTAPDKGLGLGAAEKPVRPGRETAAP